MLTRVTLLVGFGVGVAVACGGSSTEFSSPVPAKAGSGAQPGGAGKGTGGGSGQGGTGGSAQAGKGGSGGVSGGAGAGKGGAAGTSGGTGGAGGTVATAGEAGMPSGGTAGGGGVPIADAPVTVAVDLCDKIFECCSAAELMNLSVLGQSKSNCEFAVAAYLGLLLNAVTDSLTAGRLAYDGTALATCIDDYGTRSCNMLRGLDNFDCPGLLVPEVAEGDACGLSVECVDGYCDGSNDAANPVGQCVPKKQNGADCSDSAECVGGTCENLQCADTVTMALCGG